MAILWSFVHWGVKRKRREGIHFSLGLIVDPNQLRTKVQKNAVSLYCLGSEHVVHKKRHTQWAANCSNTHQISHLTRIPVISPLQSSPLSPTHAVHLYHTSPYMRVHPCNQKAWINFIFFFRPQRMSCLVVI